MKQKKTMVLGVSMTPDRYSNMAVCRLLDKGNEVIAIGNKKGIVRSVEIKTDTEPYNDIDTVTLYLNAQNQKQYYQYILSLMPKRIIFNPGAENPEFEEMASKHGIITIEACTLVMLNTGQY